MKIYIDLTNEKNKLKNFSYVEFSDYLLEQTITFSIVPLVMLFSGMLNLTTFFMLIFCQTVTIFFSYLFKYKKTPKEEAIEKKIEHRLRELKENGLPTATAPKMETPPTTEYVTKQVTSTNKPRDFWMHGINSDIHKDGVLVAKENGALVRMNVPDKYKQKLGLRFPKYNDASVPVAEETFVEWVFGTFTFDEAITYFADIRRRDMRLLESKSQKLTPAFSTFHSNPYAIKYIDTNSKGELTFESVDEVSGQKVTEDVFNDFQTFAGKTRMAGLPTKKDFESWAEDYLKRHESAKQSVEAIFTTN